MLISKDALLTTLLFLLPGFIAVGSFVLPFKWLNAPDLSRSTFVILALSLSVPLNLLFAWMAKMSPQFLRPWIDVPTVASGRLTLNQLAGLTLLYAFAAALGVIAAAIAGKIRSYMWKKAGTCVKPARERAWHRVLKSRKGSPWVVAVGDKSAYYGMLRHFTTTDEDPHIYLTHAQVAPLDSSWGQPLLQNAQEPPVDGVLLQLDSLKALWIVK